MWITKTKYQEINRSIREIENESSDLRETLVALLDHLGVFSIREEVKIKNTYHVTKKIVIKIKKEKK